MTPPTTPTHALSRRLLLGLLLAWCSSRETALADDGATKPHAAPAAAAGIRPTARPAELALTGQPPPLAARFIVTVTPGRGTKVQGSTHAWIFQRNANRVSLRKGAIDEIWHRDDKGLLSFERIFHDDRQAVDYGAGELAALGVETDWVALSTFVDPRELMGLRVVSRQGRGRDAILSLRGKTPQGRLALEWLPALQLPKRLVRTAPDGQITRFELSDHAEIPGADWPAPRGRSEEYLRFDAADFGDMDYETVVKKSEALDIRSGWRTAHHHD